MKQFKIGDKVVANIPVGHKKDPHWYEHGMRKHVGKVFTIKQPHHEYDAFFVEENNFYWLTEWLKHAGPARGPNGRFIKKEAAPAPKKEKMEKAEAPKGDTIRKALNEALLKSPEAIKNNWRMPTGICSYGFETNTGRVNVNPNCACHAAIGYPTNNFPNGLQAGERLEYFALNMHYHVRGQPEEFVKGFKKFVAWYIKDSPWKNIVLTKDPVEAIEQGILLDVNKTADELASAAIGLRSYTEFKYGKLWNRLVDDGVDGFAALLTCCGIADTLVTRPLYGQNGSHHWINHTTTVGQAKLFAEKGPDPRGAPYKDGNYRYVVCDAINRHKAGGDTLYALIQKIPAKGPKKDDGWGAPSYTIHYKDVLKFADELLK